MKLSSFKKRGALATIAGVGLISLTAFVSAQTTNTNPAQRTRSSTSTRGGHMGGMMGTSFTAVKTAITNNDYQAFLTAVANARKNMPADAPVIPTYTQAQFDTIVKAEKLRASGDQAGAMKLISDAGITIPGMRGMHGGMGQTMTNLTPTQKTAMEQAHSLMQAGKQTEATQLLTAAGITMPARGMNAHGNDAAHTAFLATLTDAQKATLTQAMNLRRSGDAAGADALLKSANITLPARPAHTGGMGRGMHTATATTVTQ